MRSPTLSLLLGLLALVSGARSLSAAEDSLVTSVYSRVGNGYQRTKLPDGSLKPEYYAISNGGYSPGAGGDVSIDRVPFPTIAGTVAQFLAGQKFYLAKDAKSADLLLVIQWGSTVPFDDGNYRNGIDQAAQSMTRMQATKMPGPTERTPDGIQSAQSAVAQAAQGDFESDLLMIQVNNTARDRANERNANLLGYMREINSRNDISRFAGGGTYFDDLVSDIEEKRYFVIVSAYDFRAATQERKQRLLWTTRVSIQAQGNRFDERLQTMVANAGREFGRDSGGRLIRRYQRSTTVDLGEMKVIGVVPESAPPPPPDGK